MKDKYSDKLTKFINGEISLVELNESAYTVDFSVAIAIIIFLSMLISMVTII